MTKAHIIDRAIIEYTPDYNSEFWRGFVARINWLIVDTSAADDVEVDEPSEPGPSQFWAGWNCAATLIIDACDFVPCLVVAYRRLARAYATPITCQ